MTADLDERDFGDDAVAQIVGRWHSIRPDLDATPMLVVGRISRLAALIDEALRPQDAQEASPGQLANETMVTTGATTKRVARLERQGYVARRVSSTDGRARVVALTSVGQRVVDDLIATHLRNESAILLLISEVNRPRLARLLGELASALEGAAVKV